MIVQCDVGKGSFVAAYRAADGREVWRESRDEILLSVIEQCIPQLAAPPAELAYELALRRLIADIVGLLNEPEWTRVLPALATRPWCGRWPRRAPRSRC